MQASRQCFLSRCSVQVLCRNKEQKWLTVQPLQKESDKAFFQMPQDFLGDEEDFHMAAARICQEQGGVQIAIKGVIRFEFSIQKQTQTLDEEDLYIIFYAEPKENSKPIANKSKNTAAQVKWMDLQEMAQIGVDPDLLQWVQLITAQGDEIILDHDELFTEEVMQQICSPERQQLLDEKNKLLQEIQILQSEKKKLSQEQ